MGRRATGGAITWAAVAVLGMCMIGWGQKTARAPSEESPPREVQRLTKELADTKHQLQAQQTERDRLQEELKQANDRIAELIVKLDMQEQLMTRNSKAP